MFTRLISNLITFKPTSALLVATNSVNNWLNSVGIKVINVVRWMACKAFKILHVSVSDGIAPGLASSNFSACINRLFKCWSFVFIVETRLKPTVNMGFCPSTQFISGPAF